MVIENRSIKAAELRIDGTNEPVIKGYAAVFNSMSENLGWFREVIRSGAFKKTINDGADVRALFNHDRNYVIARTTNNTLRLKEDERGLYIEAVPPDTIWAKDLVTSIKRGDVNQMSFAFETIKDTWGTDNGEMLRELKEVRLIDVSPVTYPAYAETSVSTRSLLTNNGINVDMINGLLLMSKRGIEITKEQRESIENTINILNQFLAKPEPGNHSGVEGKDTSQVRGIEGYRRRLEIAERCIKNNKLIIGGIK